MTTVIDDDERADAAPARQAAPQSDAELALLGRGMPTDTLRGWIVTLSITAIAAVVRLWNLGWPTDKGTPVFDEKHYVPQAWEMLRNGGYEDNYGYELVVHPPLAKQLIAIGEAIFGYNGWGWRFSAALSGIIIVLLIVRIARRLTRSTMLGGIAGVLAICDGVLHLQSRMGMLDIFLTLFIVAAFGCVLLDREQVRRRLAEAVSSGWIRESPYGPKLGVRWWRFAIGVLLGLSCAVKWSGVFFIAGFGLMVLVLDYQARRIAGVQRPLRAVLIRDLLPAVWVGVVAVAVYVGGWWSWFASEAATDRHWAQINGDGTGFWATVRSFLAYHAHVLNFHEHLDTPKNHPHPWESKPWSWPMGLRPMLYYYADGSSAGACGGTSCVGATMLIGTPAMWWLSLPVLAWSFWRSVFRGDWRYGVVLVAYLIGYLQWYQNIDRQMYFFYATPMAPFLILALTLALGQILGSARAGAERRGTGLLVVALYVGLVVANFAWLWPILNGDAITTGHWNAELWLPSWRS